jgi:nicotinamidase-related amidase
MDMQNTIVAVYAKDQPEMLPRAAGILQAARTLKMPVIHVQVGFRPGLPEIDTRNLRFGAIKNSAQWQAVFQGPAGETHPDVAPQADDIVITKHRVSAFHGTDLEMILHANRVETLVLFGIPTSGVVLSTLLHASDADYRLIVVRDCCADQDAELHACLLDKFFPKMAAVVTAEELLAALQSE